MVPVERIELPTFGLQNRCSTAELNRRIEADWQEVNPSCGHRVFGGSNTRLVRKGPEPGKLILLRLRMKKASMFRVEGVRASNRCEVPRRVRCLTSIEVMT
jgi:hypothetical protein